MSETQLEPEEFDGEMDLDLDSVLAQEAEAKREYIKVRVDGRVMEFPLITKWPLKAIYLADHDEILDAFRIVLSEDDASFLELLPGDKVNVILEHLTKVSGVTPGESSRLREIIAERPREVEADLTEYYGIDIAQYHRGEITARRLAVLISQLPHDSRTRSSTEDRWSSTNYHLANVVDGLQLLLLGQARAAGAKRVPQFKATWRPGDVDSKQARRELSPENALAKSLLPGLGPRPSDNTSTMEGPT